MYLYEMGYSQRFSNGIQVDIPEYKGGDTPVDPDPSGKGDINQDGIVDLTDVAVLLDAVTEGTDVSLEIADMNEDGVADLTDVAILMDQVTKDG